MSHDLGMACAAAAAISSRCVGSFLDRVTSISTGDRSLVDISLRQVTELGEVAFSFERILYAAFSDAENLDSAFVDEIVVRHISAESDDFHGIPGWTTKQSDGMPDLVYFHLKGPVELVVVAATVSVLKADG